MEITNSENNNNSEAEKTLDNTSKISESTSEKKIEAIITEETTSTNETSETVLEESIATPNEEISGKIIPSETPQVASNEEVQEESLKESKEEHIEEHKEVAAAPKEVIVIPEEDYTQFSQEELLASLKKLISSYPVQLIKDQVEAIRSQFNQNFDEAAAASKAEFIAEGGNEIDFYYTTPLKRAFNELYFNYKDKRNQYYKNIQTNLENNLKVRLQLIEDLKVLIADSERTVSQKFNVFKEIKENWHQAGAIPKDKNNITWNTFYHHVDKFYEIVHLDRSFRDKDFKQNLEQKVKIIERAKELTQEDNATRAFRELQVLHKIWKEEIGPVAKEYKDLIWDKFSELTKIIHDKRQAYFAEQDAKQEVNLSRRREIIAEINAIAERKKTGHNDWQKAIKEVESLHDTFKGVGRVPNEFKNSIWDEFRAAERLFNRGKNEFYKGMKGEQLENLQKKKELIEIAVANKESDDFEVTTPLMKKIQNDWKKIGHVPRKESDKIWKQFKDACNYYFDRIHNQKDEANKEQLENYNKKVSFIENIKNEALEDLEAIKTKITEWKGLGAVPYKMRKVEEDFSKVLDGLFSKLNLNKQESELIKFETKIAELKDQEDDRLIQSEKNFIKKKMDDVKGDIMQLENNLQFFKHADKSNPLVADVYKRIDKHQDELAIWKQKWQKIKSL